MTVGELIKKLETFDKNLIVLKESDSRHWKLKEEEVEKVDCYENYMGNYYITELDDDFYKENPIREGNRIECIVI